MFTSSVVVHKTKQKSKQTLESVQYGQEIILKDLLSHVSHFKLYHSLIHQINHLSIFGQKLAVHFKNQSPQLFSNLGSWAWFTQGAHPRVQCGGFVIFKKTIDAVIISELCVLSFFQTMPKVALDKLTTHLNRNWPF